MLSHYFCVSLFSSKFRTRLAILHSSSFLHFFLHFTGGIVNCTCHSPVTILNPFYHPYIHTFSAYRLYDSQLPPQSRTNHTIPTYKAIPVRYNLRILFFILHSSSLGLPFLFRIFAGRAFACQFFTLTLFIFFSVSYLAGNLFCLHVVAISASVAHRSHPNTPAYMNGHILEQHSTDVPRISACGPDVALLVGSPDWGRVRLFAETS